MEQSAVKWLINELNDIIGPIEATISGELLLAGAIKRAKEMEKEQKKFIFECGRNFQLTGEGTFEEVYNETFKSE